MGNSRSVLLGIPGVEPTTRAELTRLTDGFELRPERWVEEPQQVKHRVVDGNAIFDLFERRGVVADFQPRPLWGLEGDRPFTVIDAKMSMVSNFLSLPAQVYKASQVLWDVHIDGPDSFAKAIRLTFSLPRSGWANDETIELPEGRLTAWATDNRPGLIYEPSTSHTVHDLAQRFPTILTALFNLWTGSQTSITAIQVRIPGKGWCPLEVLNVVPSLDSHSFLPLNTLDLTVVGAWLSKSKKLGPIPFVANEDRGVLQVDAQMPATALEGLHRRLEPAANRFDPKLSNSKLEKARKQARAAAMLALEGAADAVITKTAFNEALLHVDEPSYSLRLTSLLARVERVAPGLLGPSFESWINDAKNLRNVQSHGLTRDDDFGEHEISLYYVLSVSSRWALRILLLLHLTDDEALIRSALEDSDKFMFALANMDRESYWEDFSAYETFLNAASVD
ncbi:HEPN domain-containing protein [Paenarthrobacter sp. NPDC089316]|uniref:HEPN domain-containing protein n=1 Tax=unclassified Paenarthrobacter TaxID=2634190 RepID=UPI0034127912